MRYTIVLYVLLATTMCLISCDNTSESQLSDYSIQNIDEHIEDRTQILKNSHRHKILSLYNNNYEVEKVDSIFKMLLSLPDKDKKVSYLNEQFQILSDAFEVRLIDIKSKKEVAIITKINQLLILDDLIFRTKNINNIFSDLGAQIVLKENRPKEAFYNIFLVAKDSLYSLQYELFLNKDTFLIKVNEEGVGEFSMQKEFPTQQHSFRGSVKIHSEKGEIMRIPFEY